MSYYLPDEAWDSGAVHLADGQSPARDLLVVFVHGIFQDYKGTWTKYVDPDVPNAARKKYRRIDIPQAILTTARLDADVLVFSHPSRLFHECSIEAAAKTLRDR